MKKRISFSALLCFACVLCVPLDGRAAEQPAHTPEQIAFFEKQVRPLLESTCFKCHGGEPKIKAGLRLTSREGVLKGGTQGPAVNLAKPEASLLLEMLTFKDEEHSMPPKGKLPQAQIDILAQWVKMGAPWTPGAAAPLAHAEEEEKPKITDWWAYKTVTRPAPPEVKNKAWVRNPIDAFILGKLEKEGLAPAGPADKIGLARRAYYDLTGLPPSPAELSAFVADNTPEAYEKLLDRLLASPHYGEKWGRHWLDLVRFAETNGYERDGPKPFAWRYRDYVIDAFNKDKPYDQFIQEQLAGDELDQVTPETIIATGYYRLNVWDDEPADRKLAKYDVLDGILATTCQTVMAMTINCARCHDHKKDPILQKDYYSMLAFFQDISDMQTKEITREILSPEQKGISEKKAREKTAAEDKLAAEILKIEASFKSEIKDRPLAAPVPENAKPEIILADSRKQEQIWSYTTDAPDGHWHAPDFDDSKWKKGPGGFGTNPPGAVTRTEWRTPDIWLRKKFDLPAGKLPSTLLLTIHHDEDVEVYINGTLVFQEDRFLKEYAAHPLGPEALKALKPGSNVIAAHCKQTGGGQYIDLGLSTHAGAGEKLDLAAQVKAQGDKVLGKEKREQYLALKAQLEKSRKEKPESAGIVAMAVFEKGRSSTRIFLRGNTNLEGDEVQPAFPSILKAPAVTLPAPKPNAPHPTTGKRRVLAEWLASKDNKLTARAMANRLWQFHFGRGIVRSSSDFGQLGELPTHPELLDWLAGEFMARDWKIKSMHKLIMLSSAYRMSSKDNAQALAKDPNNDLFWRFDMRRLSAEEVRDSILAVNGTLNTKMGGPSIFTEVPAEVLATSSQPKNAWGNSPPEGRSRRSVYVFVKRSLIEPILNTFDSADTDSSCPVRFTTTVPTQSLTSLNSKFFNDQAAALAKRLKKEAGENRAEQIKLALRLALGREAGASEIERSQKLIASFETQDKLSPEKALDYFCLMVLNLNEFVYLD